MDKTDIAHALNQYVEKLNIVLKTLRNQQILIVKSLLTIYVTRHGHTIHLLHAGEGNMKIYSPKSIIFPEGNTRGEYDTRG